jgi:succinoglycan biosynthesis protein ExoA
MFDEELVRNQDDEFNLRLTRAGGRIWQSPTIRSWYRPRGSLTALFRQYAQYGYWKVRVIRRHRRPAAVRHLVPACFVLSIAALSVGSLFWQPASLALLGLLGVYLFVVASASFLSVARTSPQLFPLVSLVGATFHVAYGLGFLRGAFDTLVMRRAPSSAFTALTRTPRQRSS